MLCFLPIEQALPSILESYLIGVWPQDQAQAMYDKATV